MKKNTAQNHKLEYQIEVGNPMKLGVHKVGNGMNFAIIVRDDTMNCSLILYDKETEKILTELVFTEEMRFGNIFAMLVKGISTQQITYNYRMGNQIITDPYANIVYGSPVFGETTAGKKTSGFYCDKFDWGGDKKLNYSFSDSFIYRLHVRGFTMGIGSGTRKKGTFLGILDKVPYLKSLGVTMVELLPAYDFNEVVIKNPEARAVKMTKDETEPRKKVDFWGYRSGDYFVPKVAYSYKKNPVSAIHEFKTMVRELHKQGIEVCMEFHFDDNTPIPYILDCFRHWVFNYHIDAIHCAMEPEVRRVVSEDPYLARTKFISYGFDNCIHKGMKRLGEYNQVYMEIARRFLKGDAGMLGDMAFRLRYNKEEVAAINYIASNDTMTLMDMVSYGKKHNESNGEENRDGRENDFSWNCGVEGTTKRKKVMELRKRQLKNALAFLFFSQGTPLLYAGDEFGNSCNGNNNPYCQDNEISYLDWRLEKKNAWLVEYVRELAAFRKEHHVLHLDCPLQGKDYYALGMPDVSYHAEETWSLRSREECRSFAMMLNGAYCTLSGGKTEENLYLAFNMHWEEQKIGLPSAGKQKQWELVFTTGDSMEEIRKNMEADTRYLTVPPRSVTVLSGVQAENIEEQEISHEKSKKRNR